MRFDTLQEWLAWQETLYPSAIALGLDRVSKVWKRMHPEPLPFPVILVGGTNGKGSCSAMLEAIYAAGGYRTACYTSPHLLRYNERIRIDREEVSDADLCVAFEQVDQARQSDSLTYFEFGTLAALWLFIQARPDVAILEVGMGGRLDAVNIIDADVALVTSVALDHQDWLGNDREAIGFEKAGIFRSQRPAICADPDVPQTLRQHARSIGAELYCYPTDFHEVINETGWSWHGPGRHRHGLPWPALRGYRQLKNAAAVLMVVECLQNRLPINQDAARTGLLSVHLPGRFQVIAGAIPVILDVAHNPEAAGVLAENLRRHPCQGRTLAVLGMLRDKDAEGVAQSLAGQIDCVYAASLGVDRGLQAQELAARVQGGGLVVRQEFASVVEAFQQAREEAVSGDRIVVFGSFFTVAAVLPLCTSDR